MGMTRQLPAWKRAKIREAEKAKEQGPVPASVLGLVCSKINEMTDETERRRFLSGLLDKGMLTEAGHAHCVRLFAL